MKIKNKNKQVTEVSLWSEHKKQESLEYQKKTFRPGDVWRKNTPLN
jgi:hypothetical protein